MFHKSLVFMKLWFLDHRHNVTSLLWVVGNVLLCSLSLMLIRFVHLLNHTQKTSIVLVTLTFGDLDWSWWWGIASRGRNRNWTGTTLWWLGAEWRSHSLSNHVAPCLISWISWTLSVAQPTPSPGTRIWTAPCARNCSSLHYLRIK